MDELLFLKLHALAGRWGFLDTLVIFLASQFQYVVGLALILWVFFGKTREEKRKNLFVACGAFAASLVSRFALTEIVRFYYVTPRPFVLHNFQPLIAHKIGPSFPSGHAAFFFGMAFFVWMVRPRASVFFFVAAFLIGAARVIAGVHFPADILGGAIAGFLAAWMTERVWERFMKIGSSKNEARSS